MANPFNKGLELPGRRWPACDAVEIAGRTRRPNEPSKSENLGKPKRGSKVGLSGCKRELRPLSSQSHKKKNGSLTADVILPDEAMQTRTVCLWLVMQAVISFRAVPRVLGVFDAWGSAWPSWVPHFSSVINWTLGDFSKRTSRTRLPP